MGEADIYYIDVVGRALEVLEAFLHVPKRQLTLQEISHQLHLNKNAVFRILYTLAEHGYVLKEEQRYELGPKVLDLTNAKLRHTDLLSVAGPLLEPLRDRLGETINLGVLDQNQIRYIGVWESHHPFRLAERVGARDYLHSTALGKAHLAHIPFGEVRQLLRKSGMPQQTEHTIITLSALKPELDAIRSRGYAMDRQESMLSAFCIAVPILKGDGSRPLAAISASGPVSRFTEARRAEISKALIETASIIRVKMGEGPTEGRLPEAAPNARRATPATNGRVARASRGTARRQALSPGSHVAQAPES